MDPAAVTEVDHYELDGIPLFHLPMPGETILSLGFRVGRADEPVTRGGMTHIAEHLILTPIEGVMDHANGTTEPFRVTFTKRGSPAEISRFLLDVCRSIENPRLSRMHEEARVLRTEASGRGGAGMALRLAWYRAGYQGLGTLMLPEFFLRRLDEAVLRAWIDQNLVAGNAVIWVAGDLPDDLVVDLAPGPRRPLPPADWIDGLETPTFVVEEVPGVAASFLVERSLAGSAGMQAVERRLRHALRVERGLAYDVGSEGIPIAPGLGIVTVWASCLPENADEVERTLLESIDDMAARGPTEDDIAEQHARLVRELADPLSVPGRLDAHARDALYRPGKRSLADRLAAFGQDAADEPPAPTMAERLDALWRLRPDEVAEAIRRARETMILLLTDTGFRPQRPLRPYPSAMKAPTGNGKTFEQVAGKRKTPWSRSPSAKLTVGDAGVAVNAPNGARIIGVRWTDCVAVLQGPQQRHVLARDGSAVPIFQGDWHGGRDAMHLVDRHAPRDLVVPAEP
jgi:Peptidase M16 inactive domain